MTESTRDLIARAVAELKAAGAREVFLFGSARNGGANPRDLDLAVRLSDVYPDGRSMLVLDGIQRARMRCGDDRECMLIPGVPTEITVDLWSTAIVFNAGHRIRISVSGSNAPRFEVNPNHGGDLNGEESAILALPELLFGPDHPSRLELPVPVSPRRIGGRQLP